MYTFYRTGQEKFIVAEGVGPWQDYNKIKFLWPGVSSHCSAVSTSKQNKTKKLVAINHQQDCFLLLRQRIICLDCFSSSPNLTQLNEHVKGRKKKLPLSSENQC